MSFNRENVVWLSSNGTWNIGFFEVCWMDDDEDADPEWDVEYDYDRFEWVSTGHATEDDAHNAWDGANPGGSVVYAVPGPSTDAFDEMARKVL